MNAFKNVVPGVSSICASPRLLQGVFLAMNLLSTLLIGCGAYVEPGSSPSVLLEAVENTDYEGWEEYQDDQVEFNVKVRWSLFGHEDGKFCGSAVLLLEEPGTIIRYNVAGIWVDYAVVGDVPEEGVENVYMRTFGVSGEDGVLSGWAEAVEPGEVIENANEVPEMVADEMVYWGGIMDDGSLDVDPAPMNFASFLFRIGVPSDSVVSSEPAETIIDLPTFNLISLGATKYSEEAQDDLCEFCN